MSAHSALGAKVAGCVDGRNWCPVFVVLCRCTFFGSAHLSFTCTMKTQKFELPLDSSSFSRLIDGPLFSCIAYTCAVLQIVTWVTRLRAQYKKGIVY